MVKMDFKVDFIVKEGVMVIFYKSIGKVKIEIGDVIG